MSVNKKDDRLLPQAHAGQHIGTHSTWSRGRALLVVLMLCACLRPWLSTGLRHAMEVLHAPASYAPGHSWINANKTLPTEDDVDWSKVPLGKLTPIQCWDPEYEDAPGTHCYRMAAPLDHLNQSDTRRALLAVVKYEAGGGKTPRSKVLGSVFFNPGGPGGSGVDFLRSLTNRGGETVTGAQYLDMFLESRYDVLAHDPRGVKATFPRADCWKSDAAENVDDVFHLGADLPSASSGALPRFVAHDRLEASVCKNNIGNELQYVGTAATVRDLRLLYKAVGDKVLNYIGISYGTALGSYFAAMFPDEVGRFWLDGVVDVPNYQKGLWSNNLLDFEGVLSSFWSSCAQAGPELCALSELLTTEEDRASKDKGAHLISSKFYEALESIRVQPIAVPIPEWPQLLTYIRLKATLLSAMYGPTRWPRLAAQLAPGIKDGNWSEFVFQNGFGEQVTGLADKEPPKAPPKKRSPTSNYTSSMAQSAIMGSDALENKQVWEVAQYKTLLQQLHKDSPFAAEIWINNGAGARTWPIDASEKFKGSFNTTPAFPILFGSNDLDPVTPLAFARKMASSFKGSAVLRVAGGLGHSTISLPSKCASKTIADYFVRGALPTDLDARGEKVCQLDNPPFIPRNESKTRTNAFVTALKEGKAASEAQDDESLVRLLAEEAHVGLGEHHAQWRADHGKFGMRLM